MPRTYLPEHTISVYRQQRPSIRRLILEARWASHQHQFALDHFPDNPTVQTLHRAKALHVGALTDVLSLRGAPDLDIHETARGWGATLRELDGLSLTDHPRNALDHLRTQYGRLHGHPDTKPTDDFDGEADTPPCHPEDINYPTEAQLVHEICSTYYGSRLQPVDGSDTQRQEAETRRNLICTGLLLHRAAILAPNDTAATTAAAKAGHALRTLDRRPPTSDATARAYLLDAYRDLDPDDEDAPHPVDCPGGCEGTGIVMQISIWDDQGDGIYVPVHQEPEDCLAGEDFAHSTDCPRCHGHGYTYDGGYRYLC